MSNQPTQLTRDEAIKAAKSLHRLTQLRNMAEHTENENTEQKGLHIFLTNFFERFGPNLLACFFAVEDEYEPLIHMFTRLKQRAESFEQARAREIATIEKSEVAQ